MGIADVTEARENEIYQGLFGLSEGRKFPLTREIFRDNFGKEDIDPRWLTCCVFEFAPTVERPSWLYLTSGRSNPWNQDPADYDPKGRSGGGIEFAFSVSERGDWAIELMQHIFALDLLLEAGLFPGADPFAIHENVHLRAPLNGQANCTIRNLIFSTLVENPKKFTLESGEVHLIGLIGITDPEAEFAKARGSLALIKRLQEAGCVSVTNPFRASVL